MFQEFISRISSTFYSIVKCLQTLQVAVFVFTLYNFFSMQFHLYSSNFNFLIQQLKIVHATLNKQNENQFKIY